MSKGSGDEDDLTPKVTEVSTNTPKINSSITVIQIEASSETIDGDDDIIHSSQAEDDIGSKLTEDSSTSNINSVTGIQIEPSSETIDEEEWIPVTQTDELKVCENDNENDDIVPVSQVDDSDVITDTDAKDSGKKSKGQE